MKTSRHLSIMLLAAAVLLALPTLAQAKKVTYWQSLEQTFYDYTDGKWVKESSWKDTYKKNKLASYTYTSYREWDSETQQYVDKESTRKTTYKYNKQGNTASTTTYEDGKRQVRPSIPTIKKACGPSIRLIMQKANWSAQPPINTIKTGRSNP